MKKSIKVMMSSFNGEKYIREQIASILSQQRVDVELYIRDDGSSDETVSVIEELITKFSNIHATFESNKGPSESFMDLLYSADSREYDYYAFSDQDDIWDKDKLIRAIDMMSVEDKPILYYSALLSFQENNGGKKLIVNDREYSFAECFIQSHFPGCTMVFNKIGMELIRSIDRPKSVIMHDLFLIQVFMATGNRIIYDRESRINYRVHGNNVSVKKDNVLGELKRYKKIFKKQKGQRLAATEEFYSVMKKYLNADKQMVVQTIVGYKKSIASNLKFVKLIMNTQLGIKIKLMYSFAVMIRFY